MKNQILELLQQKRGYFFCLVLGAFVWYLFRAMSGWVLFLRTVICTFPLFIFMVVLLVGLFITSTMHLIQQSISSSLSFKTFFPLIAFIVAVGFGAWFPVPPSRLEMIYYDHQDEFQKLTDIAVNKYRVSREFRFSSNPFYDYAIIYDLDGFVDDGGLARMNPDYNTPPVKIVVEYIIDDARRPLVFVASDNASEVYDTCSRGGTVIKQLEPYWYICERDWN